MTRSRRLVGAALVIACLSGAKSHAGDAPAAPAIHQAQVETRFLAAPQAVTGSDGQRHLAYEMRITSFQDTDNPLTMTGLTIFSGAGKAPLTVVEGSALHALRNQPPPERESGGIPLESGRTLTLFLWLALPPGLSPNSLQHQLSFLTAKGEIQRAEDVRAPVVTTAPIRIGPPLRGGRWMAVEGPGNALSHHWGSMVAADGRLSIPQRFATDWFGLNDDNHSLRIRHENLASSVDGDWVGYGKDVLAVADGVVVDARDGVPNGRPLTPLEGPDDLTARTLYGNFVVLQISPGTYAHYAHLQEGSVRVRVGQHVQHGATIARLGQTGSAGAPHLHFHIGNRPTFEYSEGLPFVVDSFTLYGHGRIEETFDPTKSFGVPVAKGIQKRNQLPLDGSIVSFP